MKWFPINELDVKERQLFVVIAIDVYPSHKSGYTYTSDPYCVWKEGDKFVRWPYEFPPTHFVYLPSKNDIK